MPILLQFPTPPVYLTEEEVGELIAAALRSITQRLDVLEAAERADRADDAAESTEQDRVVAALRRPILP